MKKYTYVFENEDLGWFGVGGMTSEAEALKFAIDEGIIEADTETLLLEEVDEDDVMYDDILDAYGVDVY